LNRSDYRAWYGLGQVYEMLEMHYYALYYFEHALVYKSSDWRMWQGLANCYFKLSRHADAIKAYKRAVLEGSTDTSILVSLATLLEGQGDLEGAEAIQRQIVVEGTMTGTGEVQVGLVAARAHLWLARMEISREEFEKAEIHVNIVLKGHFVPHPSLSFFEPFMSRSLFVD
jgi:anaphase-promoting complex subunit 8